MSEKKQEKVTIVMLKACRDKVDHKTRYEEGVEVELDQDRAEAAVAAEYAKYAEPLV